MFSENPEDINAARKECKEKTKYVQHDSNLSAILKARFLKNWLSDKEPNKILFFDDLIFLPHSLLQLILHYLIYPELVIIYG